MDFENLYQLDAKEKKEILADLIKNDVSYLKKILIVMAMLPEERDTEFLDKIIQHKIEEIELANKKYHLGLTNKGVENTLFSKKDASIIEKIIYNSKDSNYRKACREVLEVLKHIPIHYYNAISPKFIEKLEKDSDQNYLFVIKNKIKFTELNLLEETQLILSLISNKFWNKFNKTIRIEHIFNKMEG